ncbi:MMPL family transporter [Spongisporangium articulatum]|uniref:MMPL family transporter n=1 Tax=Spongisporangium articulatum TaxID=3362603 RepID=A0ABW8AR63_9ACTN
MGRVISRHPWWVIGAWGVAVLLAFGLAIGGWAGDPLFKRLSSGIVSVPGPSKDGQAILDATATVGPQEYMLVEGISPRDPSLKPAFDAARADILKMQGVKSVRDAWYLNGRSLDPTKQSDWVDSLPLLSDDQTAALMVVTLDPDLPVAQNKSRPEAGSRTYVLHQVRDRMQQVHIEGATTLTSSVNDIVEEVTQQVEHDLRTGEGIALPISLLIMVVVFGGFLAAGLPIIGAIAAIGGALATLLGFSYALSLDPSTVNVVTVLGLGLCIDYGLLLVSRYREEMLSLPGDPTLPPTRRQRELALRRTMTSAGRTVTFSGVTVAIALSGLMCFQFTLLRGMGAAGVSVVLVALLVALTLVPALLAVVKVRMIRPGLVHRLPVLGPISTALGDSTREEGFFSRLARLVQRFPLIVVAIVVGTLFVLSLPVLAMQMVSSNAALLPIDNPQRTLVDTVNNDFSYASTPTIQVVTTHYVPQRVPSSQGEHTSVDCATAPANDDRCTLISARPEADSYYKSLLGVPGVARIDPPEYRGQNASNRSIRAGRTPQYTVLSIRVGGTDSSPTALQAVRDIRALDPPFPAYTTGNASSLVDAIIDLENRTPYAIGVVVLTTLVLLFLMTGSVLVPIKALVMNVISLGASLGVVTWIFQFGELSWLLDFTSAGGVEVFIPPMTLAFGFGLAMDYEVFLLSRISEYKQQGYSNDESVALGLQKSGRIISSAALIIVVVFLGFVAGKLLMIKETGTALAVAVAIDATLVRMLLVPATMTLLGEWNWWAPPFLRRLHDRYGISE